MLERSNLLHPYVSGLLVARSFLVFSARGHSARAEHYSHLWLSFSKFSVYTPLISIRRLMESIWNSGWLRCR